MSLSIKLVLNAFSGVIQASPELRLSATAVGSHSVSVSIAEAGRSEALRPPPQKEPGAWGGGGGGQSCGHSRRTSWKGLCHQDKGQRTIRTSGAKGSEGPGACTGTCGPGRQARDSSIANAGFTRASPRRRGNSSQGLLLPPGPPLSAARNDQAPRGV